MKAIYHELLDFNPTGLPIKVLEMNKKANELGCDFHWHEEIEIYYVVKGSLKLNINGMVSRIHAGDIGIVNPSHLHRGSDFEENTKHYIVQINLLCLKRLHQLPNLLSSNLFNPPIIRQNQELNHLIASLIEEHLTKQPYYEIKIIGLSYTLLSALLREFQVNSSGDNIQSNIVTLHQVQSILSYVSKNYREKITLDQLSKELGISKAYMCRIFKKHTHQTIIHHINEQKCHYAASLILEGNSVGDVAFACGFNDYNYFSKVFKKIIGISPKNYINKISPELFI